MRMTAITSNHELTTILFMNTKLSRGKRFVWGFRLASPKIIDELAKNQFFGPIKSISLINSFNPTSPANPLNLLNPVNLLNF